MTGSKLIKAMMLGLCLSTLSTGVAFARMNTTTTEPAAISADLSPELESLYAKQAEIDQYIFTDHARDIEAKGIFVSYTVVNGDAIEIGITPYNDENANYFYDLFGKDQIKVVEFDQSVIYETTVVMDEAGAADPGAATEDTITADDIPLMDGDVTADAALDDVAPDTSTDDGKVYKSGEGDMSIQIESTDAAQEESDTIYYTTAAEADSADVKTVSVNESLDDAKGSDESKKDGVSAPMMVLIIAAGAAVIGGAFVITGKKKASR